MVRQKVARVGENFFLSERWGSSRLNPKSWVKSFFFFFLRYVLGLVVHLTYEIVRIRDTSFNFLNNKIKKRFFFVVVLKLLKERGHRSETAS